MEIANKYFDANEVICFLFFFELQFGQLQIVHQILHFLFVVILNIFVESLIQSHKHKNIFEQIYLFSSLYFEIDIRLSGEI